MRAHAAALAFVGTIAVAGLGMALLLGWVTGTSPFDRAPGVLVGAFGTVAYLAALDVVRGER